ncbi:MAG: hypothetical protein HY286_07415 [Planctomycetes bacterium]|nr:hypothetical protein [Planctomycetota bacterium]
MADIQLKRVFRTQSSERYLLMRGGAELAALDCHFLDGGHVQATLIFTDNAEHPHAEIEQILTWLDDNLFPEASRDAANLNFIVVSGRVIGHFSSDKT